MNRKGRKSGPISRRGFLRGGLVAGASAFASKFAHGGSFIILDSGHGGGGDGSPPTTPFVDELPIPPIKAPVAPFMTDRVVPPGTDFYEVSIREALHSFHSDLPPSLVWGYDGIYPGPTFKEFVGHPLLVRFKNELPGIHSGFGVPNMTIHRHGGFQADIDDGFPTLFFTPGQYRDYFYPSVLAGDDPREAEATLWYHDHLFDFTAENVYKGLAGFFLNFDSIDFDDETAPGTLRLPSGEFDIPLVFQDRRFDRDGLLFYDSFQHNGFIGDKMVVNGKIQPFLRVARRKYRFRMLNGANARFFEMFLSTGQPFVQIAHDDHLLARPQTVPSINLGMAERTDVVIDFKNYPIGTEILLVNKLKQTDGRGPDRIENPGIPMMKFIVDSNVGNDPSMVPNMLRELPAVNLGAVVRERLFEFERRNGSWVINGQLANLNRISANPRLDKPEIWRLKNKGGGWWHPIHIHLESFQVVTRNGRNVAPADRFREDDVVLGPNEEVRAFAQFRRFAGSYVMHCHNLEHEDVAMMVRYDTIL